MERYARKARMHYGNNSKIQRLLDEVEAESEAAETEAKKNAKKKFWLNIIEKNKKFVLIAIAAIPLFGFIWYEATADARREQAEQEENKLSKKKDKKKDKLIKKKKQQKMLKISHMFKIQLKRLMTFLIKGKLTRLPTHLRCVRLQV